MSAASVSPTAAYRLPSRKHGETTLFLSGEAAADVANCFANGAISARVLGTEPGRASALKILFAAYNKGSVALFTALYTAAQQYGVLEELQGQFARRGLSLPTIETQILRAAPKAWRWIEEMHEISAALEAVNMLKIGITRYDAGFILGVKAFTAAVLGGIGNLRGALVGGFVLGLAENYGSALVGTQWKDVVAFVLLILILLFRPTGLLGESLGKARA